MSLSRALVDRLIALTGSGGALTADAERARYEADFRRLYHGKSALVLRPDSVQAVSALMALAARERIAIVPFGGNTSYCGGATVDFSGAQVVMSLERLNTIRAVDAAGYTITVDAGCVLADVQRAASEAGRLLALSLGSEGTCQIGGTLSTNAGGTSVLRYGMMREQVLGLEVVLPDGRLLNQLSALRKDNTGYDVKQWFLGAEGTLGIITGACLKLRPQPHSTLTAMAGIEGLAAAVRLLSRLRDAFGESVTAFEFLPAVAVELARKHVPGARLALTESAPAYVLLEIDGADTPDGHERLLSALDCAREIAVARSVDQADAMWFLREHIPEAQKREGASLKHDVALPIACLADFTAAAARRLDALVPGARLVAYGHVGDGNLHFNLSPRPGDSGDELLAAEHDVRRAVHDLVAEFGGSFSAEHGIGRLKVDELERYEDPVALELMRALKQAIDPQGIMNPGKVLR